MPIISKITVPAWALLFALSLGGTGCSGTRGPGLSASVRSSHLHARMRGAFAKTQHPRPTKQRETLAKPKVHAQASISRAKPAAGEAVAVDLKTANGLHIPSPAELELFELINDYRADHNLKPVRWSRSLSHIAWLHARDLSLHHPAHGCMIHSWSQNPAWKSCCYTPDHARAKCMWNKPLELTQYKGIGFEIAYVYTAGVRPRRALKAWSQSPRHRDLILNLAVWSDATWRAIGVGIDGDYATVWVGEDLDPAGYWNDSSDNRM